MQQYVLSQMSQALPASATQATAGEVAGEAPPYTLVPVEPEFPPVAVVMGELSPQDSCESPTCGSI